MKIDLEKELDSLHNNKDYTTFYNKIFNAFVNGEIDNNKLFDVLADTIHDSDDAQLYLAKYLQTTTDEKILNFVMNVVNNSSEKKSQIDSNNEEDPSHDNNWNVNYSGDILSASHDELCNRYVKSLIDDQFNKNFYIRFARMNDETYAAYIKQLVHCKNCDKVVDKDNFFEIVKEVVHLRPAISERILLAESVFSIVDDETIEDIQKVFIECGFVDNEIEFKRILNETKIMTDVDDFGPSLIKLFITESALIDNGVMSKEKVKKLRGEFFKKINIGEKIYMSIDKAPEGIRDEIKSDYEYLKQHPETMVVPFIGFDEDPENFDILKSMVNDYMNKNNLWEKDPMFWNRANEKRYVVFYGE